MIFRKDKSMTKEVSMRYDVGDRVWAVGYKWDSSRNDLGEMIPVQCTITEVIARKTIFHKVYKLPKWEISYQLEVCNYEDCLDSYSDTEIGDRFPIMTKRLLEDVVASTKAEIVDFILSQCAYQ